jgi:hypothetical protein
VRYYPLLRLLIRFYPVNYQFRQRPVHAGKRGGSVFGVNY